MHSRVLKCEAKNADRICMGHDQTSVIDATTTTVGTATAPSVRRNRRLAVATAVVAVAAGAVVWSTSGTDPASADRQARGEAGTSASAASPSLPAANASAAPTQADPSANAVTGSAPSAGQASTPVAPAPAPAGWESRTFQGVTFSVPPGAVAPDAQDPGNADVPPSFVWTGPSVGDGTNAQITVRIMPGDQAPTLGPEYQSITVPGADQGHMRTGAIASEPPMTAVDVHVLAGGKFINVVGMFAAGPEGEQAVRDLVASLRIG